MREIEPARDVWRMGWSVADVATSSGSDSRLERGITGREKPAECWFPGPVSSALRVLRAVKVLSWDEVGYTRLLEDWTGIPLHQNARTVCLTIVGMAAPVLGSVMVGQTGDQTWLRTCVSRVGWRVPTSARGLARVKVPGDMVSSLSCMCCKEKPAQQQKRSESQTCCWWVACVSTHTATYEEFMVLWKTIVLPMSSLMHVCYFAYC